ncbi:4Fe-4S dicluster domain-containing protein [Arcobacteraceae bacterium]|nr:4Fe-4S dicluster domain-containing protein [Arcobacteraceae bacterium]
MSLLKAPENTPVWIDITRCKACDICVSACPAGVLSMRQEPSSVLGAIIDIVAPEDCIGCTDCEIHCPDFAIYVADKKSDSITFAKLTPASEKRARIIRENNYRLPLNYQK